MRVMTAEEMEAVIRHCRWATICTVAESGQPYAVEATPFQMNARHCFMINPRGGTWKNLRHGSHVLLKYTFASDELDCWAGVSCYGKGEFILDGQDLQEGWRLLGEVVSADYSDAAKRFSHCKDRSPLFSVKVQEITGRCSAAKGADMKLPV